MLYQKISLPPQLVSFFFSVWNVCVEYSYLLTYFRTNYLTQTEDEDLIPSERLCTLGP